MARGLSDHFMNELTNGSLKSLLDYINKDDTLDLKIREDYINIYYRGGNILRVTPDKQSIFSFHFNPDYVISSCFADIGDLNKFSKIHEWKIFFPFAKQHMDFYFSKHPKLEREFQQLVVRENNYSSVANGTDYFIIDIEYNNHADAQFDLIAVEWPSRASERKLAKDFAPKLIVIEMKYSDGALTGNAGMQKHIDDFMKFNSNESKVSNFKNEMLKVLRQKRVLGVIPCLSDTGNKNDISSFAPDIEMMFLVANHDPDSTKLKTEVTALTHKDVKFLTSCYMGYGLYIHRALPYSEFLAIL